MIDVTDLPNLAPAIRCRTTEVDAGCALGRRADVVGLVCAGDL